ncbi:MAG: NAD-specific glutamate dehydrogenase [Motiliproteus sp.]
MLSDVVPILENLGMQVIGEHPYAINRADGQRFWIHDYTLAGQDAGDHSLQHSSELDRNADGLKQLFQHAFISVLSEAKALSGLLCAELSPGGRMVVASPELLI